MNCIEIVGCCKEIAAGLVDGVNRLLPDAKVVTVKQVVATQQNVNHMMGRLSIIFLAIIVVVGGSTASPTICMRTSTNDDAKWGRSWRWGPSPA